ncbi:hypothetical protein L1887_14463 [Cichorium endivia]|nr:hypothetical protein L1887_14463 [Cichorium endivia]
MVLSAEASDDRQELEKSSADSRQHLEKQSSRQATSDCRTETDGKERAYNGMRAAKDRRQGGSGSSDQYLKRVGDIDPSYSP